MIGQYFIRIYEPFSLDHSFHLHDVDGSPLGQVAQELGDQADQYIDSVLIDEHYPPVNWKEYVPQKDQTIALFPKVGSKTFSNDWLDKLNSDHGGGIFLRAVSLETPASGTQHFVSFERQVDWNGISFLPLFMQWSGVESDRGMTVPQMAVTVPALNGTIMNLVEEVDIREQNITFRILHLDLNVLGGDTSSYDSATLQVQTITADDLVVVFNCSLTISLEDFFPRGAIMKNEYPGIPENTSRILI